MKWSPNTTKPKHHFWSSPILSLFPLSEISNIYSRSDGAGVSNPDHALHVSTGQPPLIDQPSIPSHAASSVAHLVRVSSAGRDGTGSGKRATPESSPGIKMFTRHNLTFSPVNTKPPMPPRSLNNNRSSSGEIKRPIPKLDRSQRSSVSNLLGRLRSSSGRSHATFPVRSVAWLQPERLLRRFRPAQFATSYMVGRENKRTNNRIMFLTQKKKNNAMKIERLKGTALLRPLQVLVSVFQDHFGAFKRVICLR